MSLTLQCYLCRIICSIPIKLTNIGSNISLHWSRNKTAKRLDCLIFHSFLISRFALYQFALCGCMPKLQTGNMGVNAKRYMYKRLGDYIDRITTLNSSTSISKWYRFPPLSQWLITEKFGQSHVSPSWTTGYHSTIQFDSSSWDADSHVAQVSRDMQGGGTFGCFKHVKLQLTGVQQ